MRVLFITRDFFPLTGGVANFIHNLANEMGREGHTVWVLAPEKKGYKNIRAENYNICWCPVWRRLSSLPFIFHTLRIALTRKMKKVFLGHFMATHALGSLILRLAFNVPYAILTHGNDLRYSSSTSVDKITANFLLSRATLVICNSRFTAKKLREKNYSGKIKILHPGVDTNIFRPETDSSEIKERYHLDGRKVIITVARLVDKKNVDGVLRALPKVIEYVPNVLYLIIGEGKKEEELKKLVDELKVNDYVRFLGKREHNQLSGYYCACDLYVMPSREEKRFRDTETFGISYIEANACGKPVIGGRSGGVSDAVIHGKTGVLVDPYNPGEIANAIINILTDDQTARSLGEKGRMRAEEELSWKNVGKRFEKVMISV